MKTPVLPALHPLPARPVNPWHGSRGRKLRAFRRKHRILTFKAEVRKERPWVAILVQDADRRKDAAAILSGLRGLYQQQGWLSTGNGELTAVRALCDRNQIPCPL